MYITLGEAADNNLERSGNNLEISVNSPKDSPQLFLQPAHLKVEVSRLIGL